MSKLTQWLGNRRAIQVCGLLGGFCTVTFSSAQSIGAVTGFVTTPSSFSSFYLLPYGPEPLYRDGSMLVDPDGVYNGNEYNVSAQLIMKWDGGGVAFWPGYSTELIYPDVKYFELRSSFEGRPYTQWQNVGYVSAIYFNNLAYGDYTYELRSCNHYGCNEYEVSYLDVTLYEPPGAPLTSITYKAGQAGYSVKWQHTTGDNPTKYYLKENINGQGWGAATKMGMATSKQYTSQIPQTYYYRVQACNQGGCSNWSTTRSVTVAMPSTQCPLSL